MKIIVHDSSVLVDMIGCELLEPWFGSGLQAVTTRLVLHEMNRKAQRSRLQRFVDDKKLDDLVRSRLTREGGYPGHEQLLEKTGFPFSRE